MSNGAKSHAYAHCNNCSWKWVGNVDFTLITETALLIALGRMHSEQSKDCGASNISTNFAETYFCLLCMTTTTSPHRCPIFHKN
jgi:hypothetical protein